MSESVRIRRNRHDRFRRGPLLPAHLPAFRNRRERFEDLVAKSAGKLVKRYPKRLKYLQVLIQDVPPADPAPWEEYAIVLGRYYPADRAHPPRIVLYRRSVENRADSFEELESIVRQVVCEQVATMLNLPPEDIDPELWS